MSKNLSHSKLSCFNSCPRKYKLRYVYGYEKRVKSNALRFGSLLHKGLEELYQSGIEKALNMIKSEFEQVDKTFFSQKDHDDQDWTEVCVPAAIVAWNKRFYIPDTQGSFGEFKVIDMERKFEALDISNPECHTVSHALKWTFIADMVVKIGDNYWLVEYKTASRVDGNYLDRLEIDSQISSYLFYLQKIYKVKFAGVIYRIFKKPGIRKKKTESKNEFYNRLENLLREDMDDYLIEHKIYRSVEDLNEWKQDLWDHANNFQNANKNKAFPKNTSSCVTFGACEYLPLCTKTCEIEQIYTKGE